jgi:hypothetical protein
MNFLKIFLLFKIFVVVRAQEKYTVQKCTDISSNLSQTSFLTSFSGQNKLKCLAKCFQNNLCLSITISTDGSICNLHSKTAIATDMIKSKTMDLYNLKCKSCTFNFILIQKTIFHSRINK